MCTTMIVTKGATIDGSIIVAHSDDDELGDQRIIQVPAQNHRASSTRKIFKEHYRYPRLVSNDRGPNYKAPPHEPPYKETEAIGEIPQVEYTYAYFDGNYGIMNEHNLMMGECTNGAKFQPEALSEEVADKLSKHRRIMYSQELSRIALERCKTAREAIELMGDLIEQYGYYSTGETLLVADEDEAWVFEMCALPDEQYHSVWVAKQVPDGDFFVAANEFRIREVKPDADDILYSKFLFPGLEKVGWWNKEDGILDWLPAVSDGEYNHPYYSLRRVWRVLDRVNPDLALSPWVKDGFTKDYPFSIKPNRKLDLKKVFSLYRDHYEGTGFDLTKGVAAGPYNDPHRFVGPYDGNQNNITEDKKFYGAWERSISVFYQGYTFVNQVRPNAPEPTKGIVWFGPDVSYTTCFVPLPVKINELPKAYQTGSPQKLDNESAWWAFDFVNTLSRLNFKRITEVDIKPLQEELEDMEIKKVELWDETAKKYSEREAIENITAECIENSKEVLNKWWGLSNTLIVKYSDGYINLPDQDAAIDVGYSAEWLSYTNYKEGPTSYDMRLSSETEK
ncbi:MAG: C69 family dipeptidase [Thermodesulfobacteriota bacterium]|nr:C69 family dipeptidase [Thermodesulfobacteriota bacterium]